MIFPLFYIFFEWIIGLSPGIPELVIRESHDAFTADPLGNIYLVTGAEVVKYNAGGIRTARYSNLRLGDVSTIDAMNPLKILLHYRDFQQVVFVDNQLSPNGKAISLEQLGLEQADLVCASVNNSFWIYDKRNNELFRFDQNQSRIASTGNLRQVLNGDIVPRSMKEYNNLLYLNCPGSGIYVFDIFGAFTRLIPIKDAAGVQVAGDLVYTFRPGALCSYDQKKLQEACDSLMTAGGISIEIANGKRYCSYRDSLVVRSL